MESEVLLQRIKELVCAIEPTAQIFLYGSRARQDARPDSDWDILILVDGIVNPSQRDRLRHQIYDYPPRTSLYRRFCTTTDRTR